jgi:hypothetical protein
MQPFSAHLERKKKKENSAIIIVVVITGGRICCSLFSYNFPSELKRVIQ